LKWDLLGTYEYPGVPKAADLMKGFELGKELAKQVKQIPAKKNPNTKYTDICVSNIYDSIAIPYNISAMLYSDGYHQSHHPSDTSTNKGITG